MSSRNLRSRKWCLPYRRPWSLLRRVYFDLIGLPPSYEDMQRFTSGQETFEQVVDRLLANPQYGERWGRTGWMSYVMQTVQGMTIGVDN